MRLNNYIRKRRENGSHIRTHIIISYLILVLTAIALLWVTQIFWLQRFYEADRTRSAEQAADTIADYFSSCEISSESDMMDMEDYFDSIALENELSYMILNSSFSVVHENDRLMLFQYNIPAVESYINYANVKGGKYITSSPGSNPGTKVILICSVLGRQNLRQRYYLIVNAQLTPVGTTIGILRKTTYIVTILLVVFSVFLALIMSKSLAKPIQDITVSADKLARGEYKTEFKGGNYSETRQLARTLNYASSEISKIDELQRDLIANVSHDLRTPLTMIKAYAEMIRDLSGDRKEKREEHLGIIIQETDRLALLVNDMLDLSKLENGSVPLNCMTFDISAKLHDIMERYKEFSAANGYTINYTESPSVLVKCDMGKIEQVIYNLVNNAINYTGEDKQIYVSMETEDEFVKINIRDTGKGISEENIHQIFDKYYRCEKTRREVVGTGLGLSIVRAVMKAHNFPFGVQSTLGEGTTFWFKIRRDKEAICL